MGQSVCRQFVVDEPKLFLSSLMVDNFVYWHFAKVNFRSTDKQDKMWQTCFSRGLLFEITLLLCCWMEWWTENFWGIIIEFKSQIAGWILILHQCKGAWVEYVSIGFYREKKQKFNLLHKIDTRWRNVSKNFFRLWF